MEPFRHSHFASAVVTKFQHWYEPLIDWMLANPDKKAYEAAAVFKKSVNYIYTVMASDVFKERYAERRAQITAELNDQILNRTARVAIKGLEIIENRLERQDVSKIKLETLSDVTNSALQRLGYGMPRGTSVVVNNTNGTVVETGASRSAVEEARKEIRSNQFDQTRALASPGELVDPEPELPLEGAEMELVLFSPPETPVRPGPLADLDQELFGDDNVVTLEHSDA